jgi:hypothetical protein
MLEEAQEIFEYLPIRSNQVENDYITHLWSAIVALSNGEEAAQPFIMMPFHLLFMLALQYKILRIAKEENSYYKTAFTIHICRNADKVACPDSVFTLTNLKERSLIDLLKLINVEVDTVQNIKKLVDYRNNTLAHANGGIATNPDDIIEQYLNSLREIQRKLTPLNRKVAIRWKQDSETSQDLVEFAELHLAEEYICPADLKTKSLVMYGDALGIN